MRGSRPIKDLDSRREGKLKLVINICFSVGASITFSSSDNIILSQAERAEDPELMSTPAEKRSRSQASFRYRLSLDRSAAELEKSPVRWKDVPGVSSVTQLSNFQRLQFKRNDKNSILSHSMEGDYLIDKASSSWRP